MSAPRAAQLLVPVHPQVVGSGARRLPRFTVAPLTALAEFQPPRLIHAEGRAPTNRQLRDAPACSAFGQSAGRATGVDLISRLCRNKPKRLQPRPPGRKTCRLK